MTEMVEPLHGMLQAESPDERHAAALALLPLGGASESLPVLLAAVRTDTKLLERSSEALKWLPAPGRSELFWALLDAAPNDKARSALVGALSTVDDPRDAAVFWKLLEREEVSGELLQALEYALRQSCFGERYYDLSSITPRQRKEALAVIEPHVGTGPAAKRLVAILLLAPVAAERAIEETRRLMSDRSLSDGIRLDAFQILLLTHTPADRTQQAIEALSDPDPRRQKIALTFLALGNQSLATLTGSGLDLTFALLGDAYFSSHSFGNEGKIIIPEPPRLLEAKHVRPLLISTNPESAAYAGYLLTLFGEPDGLAPLLRHWRTQKDNSRLNRLVYRAIAVLDDPQYMPILREIYSRLKDESDVDEFYWTIRIMSGPEILQFRKRLRKEVGMPNLQ